VDSPDDADALVLTFAAPVVERRQTLVPKVPVYTGATSFMAT
jgi:hypothetical protein